MAYQTYQYVILEQKEHVGILTINRAEKLNAINPQLATEFRNALLELNDDKEVRALLIRAAGDDFGSGRDVRETEGAVEERARLIFGTMDTIYKPIIGAWQGRAIGGSYVILLHCDIVVASEDARFQSGQINRGFTNVWCMKRMERLVGTRKAFEWIMSGDYVSAAEAERYGFANKVVPREKLDEAAMEMAGRFAGKSPLAMQVSKEGWLRAREMSIADSEAFLITLAESRLRDSEDRKEARAAISEKRAPVFKGH
ncbi:MAG: enoyl-CoA hydratase/isomerase family protein [Chloroflexi bacterium]|nr:enoyl-CoA hydratase/isomerase family protein [Chloroflexota bacterium]